MSRNFNYERASKVLIDAIYMGDRATAEKWELSMRSIDNYRARLLSDPILAEFFKKARDDRRSAWAEEIPEALASCISFIKRSTNEADPGEAEAISAISAAISTLADVALTQRMIDERLRQAGSADQEAE